MAKIVERVMEIASQELNVDRGKITPESALVDELGADPEQVSSLMKAVEKKFAVKIPAEKGESFRTVNDVANFVKSVPISNRVTNVVVQYLAVDPERVVPEASFVDDLGADSLAQTELIMEFEEVFQLGEIPEDDAQKIITVGDATKYLEEHSADAG